MRPLLSMILFFTTLALVAQEKYPQNSFRSPMDIPLVLAGSFGELRSDHFHSGLDIKTQQREGLPVMSIADGTVTRIKISHWGYGKVLYVAHPNGYTSVYAHLKKFGPGIEEYVKNVQYTKQSYEVEIFPNYGELKVSQGQTIAYSGNTGGSSGPHLHFEIRSSVSERPVNPLHFGYEVRDATNPVLLGLYGYPLSEGSVIDQSADKVQINFKKQPDGSFLANKVTAVGSIDFGVNSFDRFDMAANPNGLYSLRQSVDGKVYSQYTFDSFSFAETRYINALIDYGHQYAHRQRIQKCFKEPYNHLTIYKELYNDGKIEVKEGDTLTVEILLSDFAGNQTKLLIPVEGKREAAKSPKNLKAGPDFILADKPNNFDLGAAKVYFPA